MPAVTAFVAALCGLPLTTLVLLVALAALGLAGFAIHAVLVLTKAGRTH
jgi:hypothetical protein